MAIAFLPSFTSQLSYNQPVKKECRRRLIEHAVKHLTTERDTSVCVQRDHVRKVWHHFRTTTEGAFAIYDEEFRDNIEDEISQWERFHKSQVQTRKPSNLRVCYLAGENSINDMEVFLELGILPQNLWTVAENPKALQEAFKSIGNSKLRNVRLFKGNNLNFLEEFEGQYDIIYFDGFGAVPSSQETLKVIGYVFLFNKLTSPGALITNFSFPRELPEQTEQQREEVTAILSLDEAGPLPVQAEQQQYTATTPSLDEFPPEKWHGCEKTRTKVQPADSERDLLCEMSRGYLKHRLRNTSGDALPQACNDNSLLEKSDELNYGDYITFQVIDSAYLYIPVQRMLSSHRMSGGSSTLWNQIFESKNELTKEAGLVSEALFPDHVPNTITDICSELQDMSSHNSPCQAWINQIFPGFSTLKKKELESLTLTYLLSYSYDFIIKFANKDFKNCVERFFPDRFVSYASRYPNLCRQTVASMAAGLLYGQMAYPSFPVVDKLLRLQYTAKERQMFSDVFIFDKCRYVYEQLPNAGCLTLALSDPVLRIVVDGLRKHLARICHVDVFQHVDIRLFENERVTLHVLASPRIPRRQRVEKLMKDKPKEEGNAIVKEEGYGIRDTNVELCCEHSTTKESIK